ncbi:MAG TPA: DUF6585 family protein [Polyangiaceae bacterium]|jgi:hypothetical protein
MSEPYRLRASRPASSASASELLGPAVRSYYGAANRHVVWAAAPFVLLLAYGVWLAREGLLTHWFNSTFSVVAVTTLFVLSVALIVYTAAVGGGELVRVHVNGLLDLRAGPRAVPWDEMHSLTAVWAEDGSGVERHLLRTTGGATLSLGRSIGGVDDLVDELRLRMIEQQAPALRTRIAEGDVVRFGAFEARTEGLALGARVLPWDELAEIDAEDGQIVVTTRANERWGTARLDEVPNAFLLAELGERRRT